MTRTGGPRRRLPRLTLRIQLTLLYAGPFFLSGAALLAIPILQVNDTEPAGLQIGAPHPALPEPHVHRVLAASGIGLAVMVLVSFVLGWLIAGRFLRPLRMITATAQDISASNLHRRLRLGRRHDEFKELGETLNDLFGRLEASFASQRHFVANASHELRTPLTAERALLQVALADRDATTEALRSACEEVLALGEQQERLIEALLTLASSERGIERREPFDLAEVAAHVVQARRAEAGRRGVRIDARLTPAPAAGDPSLVESLVANLVDNALRHNVTGGRVEIAITANAGRPGVFVGNTGPVIPPGQVERLFQPFQQLGGQRVGGTGGHGLGLAIVQAIAHAHDATLSARARPGGGLDVDVVFSPPQDVRPPPAQPDARRR
ncbi:HAMP domain-containing sensor histidine kinase [Actinoallomurus bryophytorum]|uniref:histidine kinase n=1 Tax=Actinoallomurus bryophytorum TaxID=1490222 RepID=A0A543CQ46_9ACTN|nr:HAMP domain-containing sensor histidine kinase [Actinoallomurus bryophytorum]TQL99224.1 signal transduction histidine kinase [Actinoallomurus bryophytorum]